MSTKRLTRTVWLAPILFVAHVAEEAPGFVRWINSLIDRGISFELFLTVNIVGFFVTLLLAATAATSHEKPAFAVLFVWLGFVMLGNAVLHAGATVVLFRYSPGVVTASVLYVPYFVWLVVLVGRSEILAVGQAVSAAMVGAIPMLIHGYSIVFEGRRFF